MSTLRRMTEIEWPADCGPSERWPIYTRGNVGEVYPDVVLPFEWDVAGLGSEQAWRSAAEAIGFVTPDDYGPGDFVLLGVFGGYAYFNASLMRLLGVRTPGLATDVIDTQLLGDANVPAYSPRPGDRNLKATMKVVRTALRTMRAKNVPLVDEMRVRVDAYRALAPALDEPDDVLWSYLKSGASELWQFLIGSHVIVTMQATIASGGLSDLCEKHLGDRNLALVLTTGLGDVVSAQPALDMWQLANETNEHDFDREFARFLDQFGHRGPNEFSLLGRDWASFPEVALAAVDSMRGVDPSRSPFEQGKRMVAQREDAVMKAKKDLGWRGRRLDGAIKTTALWSRAREESKNQVIRSNQRTRQTLLELLRRATDRGGVEDRVGPMLLNEEEFLRYLSDPPTLVPLIENRRVDYERLKLLDPPFAFDTSSNDGAAPPVSTWEKRLRTGDEASTGDLLRGAAGAPGKARGRARVVTDPGDPAGLQPGEVLIAPLTDPSWTPLFVAAAAVVVEVGAAMSHSMIVSRELGIPCVVGVEGATRRIVDGTDIEVDGQAGTVRLL
jgi:phosphohistidine swiveling domain-containing protein